MRSVVGGSVSARGRRRRFFKVYTIFVGMRLMSPSRCPPHVWLTSGGTRTVSYRIGRQSTCPKIVLPVRTYLGTLTSIPTRKWCQQHTSLTSRPFTLTPSSPPHRQAELNPCTQPASYICVQTNTRSTPVIRCRSPNPKASVRNPITTHSP